MNMYDEKKINSFIKNELSQFYLKKQTKGFKYLCNAIYICIKNEDALDNLTKNVYPQIAERYKEKSPYNVKWCIEQVIKTMYNNTEISILCKYFDIEENLKPSVKFIIYTIVCNSNNRYVKSNKIIL